MADEVPHHLYHHLSPSEAAALIATAHALVNPRGKGIYATDEDPEVIGARLAAALGEEGKGKTWSDKEKRESRKRWRECIYESIPSKYISGVILYPETLLDFGLAPILSERNIIPGVRANGEEYPLPSSLNEPATHGLDDLLPRMQAARRAGALFSKFRTGFVCTGTLPTQLAIDVQAETLARFAATSQQAGLVPIVEPDVDFSGDADIARSLEVHEKIISAIYARCSAHGVLIEGSLIKPSFPQPGMKHPSRANVTPQDIALATITALSRSLPVAVSGVAFLSGGLSDADSAAYLRAVNALVNSALPGCPMARLPPMTFSFGRGLQGDAMALWVAGNEADAKEAFEKRAKVCSLAALGLEVDA